MALFLTAGLLACLVLGCGLRANSTPALTATASASPTALAVTEVSPTATPLPTRTTHPQPSATPWPTRTPSPQPSPTALPTFTARPPSTATPSPTPAPGKPIFGMQLGKIEAGSGLDLAVDAGLHWVRHHTLRWDKIEPQRTDPPTYHWEAVDEASLREAARRGLEVVALVQFTPEWAQAVPGSYCGPVSDQALPDMARFLSAAVARYSVPPYHVRYWELGNEPDIDPALVEARSVFGCWGDLSDEYYGGRSYAQMLKVAYPAIKAKDPKAVVLNGGLLLDRPSGGNDTHPRFLEGILEAGGGDYIDVLSFHAYSYYQLSAVQMGNPAWPGSPTVMPAKVAFIRDLLSRYGHGDKPLMNTESALLCVESSPECLEAQAAHAARSYAEAAALGLVAQIHYSWINEHWRHTGLVLPDLQPKPSYHAYKAASSFLAGASYRGPAVVSAGVEGYTFATDQPGTMLDVLWSKDGGPHSMSLPAGASVFDHYGQPVLAGSTLVIDGDPVYVIRTGGTGP
jgi:hypothetical protein